MRIGLRILLGYFLIVALAGWLLARVFVQEVKPGVRQAMEDTLVDTANVLAELASDDFLAGRIDEGRFASRVRALAGRDPGADIWGFPKRAAATRVYVTDARGTVVFDSAGRDLGKDYSRWNDVYLTLRGRYGARSTREDPADEESTVMHVAAPIRDARGRVVGVLTVARPNRAIAPFIARSQAVVLRWGLLLLGTALLVGVIAAAWLSRQIGALKRYADATAAGERAVPPDGAGEFGDLGRALQAMRTELEGKQYVERYVHALTHELKSPLTAIRGAAELLEGGDALPAPDRDRFVATVQGQAGRLTQMVDKLLALAAVEYRQRIERSERVDVAALMDEAAAHCAQNAATAGVAIEVGHGPSGLRVDGDRFLLRQALVNLLENAIAFSPAGSRIALAASTAGREIRLSVSDDGPGVPGYAASRVFERFYSLPRPGGGSRSSGLGLCFVAEVAQLHGGVATLANRDGGGAIATLVLPAA